MKLGVEHMWGASLEDFRAEVRLSGELGYDIIGIGDSPAAWHDLYVSMTIAAMETEKAMITPFVTGPFLRHPLTVANGFSSLQDFSGGRMGLGLAVGGGNVIAIGRKPATLVEMKEYWDALDNLFDGKPITWEGRPVAPLHYPRKTPVYYSAFGPKAMKLAGERADGAIIFTDGDLEDTARKIHIIHQAAKDAGRKPKDVEIWVTAFCSIRDTREQAIDDIKAFLVTNALTFLYTPEKLATVPPDILVQLRQLEGRYDVSEHCVVNGKNVQALNELGPELTEHLTSIHTVAGTPEYVKSCIDGLEDIGVSAFITNLPGHADRAGHIRALAELVKG